MEREREREWWRVLARVWPETAIIRVTTDPGFVRTRKRGCASVSPHNEATTYSFLTRLRQPLRQVSTKSFARSPFKRSRVSSKILSRYSTIRAFLFFLRDPRSRHGWRILLSRAKLPAAAAAELPSSSANELQLRKSDRTPRHTGSFLQRNKSTARARARAYVEGLATFLSSTAKRESGSPSLSLCETLNEIAPEKSAQKSTEMRRRSRKREDARRLGGADFDIGKKKKKEKKPTADPINSSNVKPARIATRDSLRAV